MWIAVIQLTLYIGTFKKLLTKFLAKASWVNSGVVIDRNVGSIF